MGNIQSENFSTGTKLDVFGLPSQTTRALQIKHRRLSAVPGSGLAASLVSPLPLPVSSIFFSRQADLALPQPSHFIFCVPQFSQYDMGLKWLAEQTSLK